MPRPTIGDVARIAGVSKSTVSRVLSGNTHYMRDDTRVRVLHTIEELEYRPSGVARSLVSKRTQTVGLLISDIGNPFYTDVIRGAEDVATLRGYGLLLCNTNYNLDRGWQYLQTLIDKAVDGILFMSSRISTNWLQLLTKQEIPAVVFGALLNHPGYPGLGVITQDFNNGIAQAVDHLLALGHRRFAHVSGPLDLELSRVRRDAFVGALKSRGIEAGDIFTIEGNLRTEGGRLALDQLLELTMRPTAVFAGNDLTAIGIVWAARDRGLRIPEDLSVIGRDNIPLAAEITPRLTTIALERYATGAAAMEMLLDLSCQEPQAVLQPTIEMPSVLVVRQSTGPADVAQ